MTNMEIKREALEMDEMEIVSGGNCWLPIKRDKETGHQKAWCGRGHNHMFKVNKPAFVNETTVAYGCEYDKEDMEYLEDILDPEDLYNYFAV